jgi:hypothetical protein
MVKETDKDEKDKKETKGPAQRWIVLASDPQMGGAIMP